MFVGHYAPAFALATGRPLWWGFTAGQAVDHLFFALVPLGVEALAIDPTQPGSLALQLGYMPFSHGLAATVGWGALAAALTRSPALGLCVASHWLLDLPMHTPDLPLWGGDGPRVGLGLWTHPVAAWGLEVGLLAAAAAVYVRREGGLRGRRAAALAGGLIALHTLQTFVVPLPPSALAVAAMSQVTYALCAAAAWWVEAAPRPVTADG